MTRRLAPALIRGARALLDWSMVDLADAAGLSISTVKRVEAADPQSVSDDALATIQGAFEMAGIRFLDDQGEGIGLRLQH